MKIRAGEGHLIAETAPIALEYPETPARTDRHKPLPGPERLCCGSSVGRPLAGSRGERATAAPCGDRRRNQDHFGIKAGPLHLQPTSVGRAGWRGVRRFQLVPISMLRVVLTPNGI